MKQIRVLQAAGIYSQRGLDTYRVFDDLPRNLWAIEYNDKDGIPQEVVTDCNVNSQGWTGWTFLSGAVPVLLFEHEEDAFWAEFRHGSGSRLNTLEEHSES